MTVPPEGMAPRCLFKSLKQGWCRGSAGETKTKVGRPEGRAEVEFTQGQEPQAHGPRRRMQQGAQNQYNLARTWIRSGSSLGRAAAAQTQENITVDLEAVEQQLRSRTWPDHRL